MKILFIVWDLSIVNDANINIAKIISNEIIDRGHKVYMLGKCNSTLIPKNQFSENINFRYIETNEGKNDKKIICNDMKSQSFMKHIFIRIQKYIVEKIKIKRVLQGYVQKIEGLCKEEEIDVAISINSPFITSIALANANIKSKKVVYQLDPYFSHYIPNKKRKKLKQEVDVIKRVDTLFVTKLILNENKNNELCPYVFKMHPIDFPNIRQVVESKDIYNIKFNNNYINCVFIGNLYRDIRNPDYVLRVFNKMKNNNIVFHFIGGGETEELYEFKETLGDRLAIHGVVNNEKAINAMLNADILINIGNTIANQMPSKIFDYISSGKPIINFVKMYNCPTLEFTKKYPLCLNVFESSKLTNVIIKEIEDFCTESKGKQIDFSLIKEIYNDCTCEVVVNKFLDRIKKP